VLALPDLHIRLDLVGAPGRLGKLELLPALAVECNVGIAQVPSARNCANRHEIRKDEGVAGKLLAIGLAPASSQGRLGTLDIGSKGLAVGIIQVAERHCDDHLAYGFRIAGAAVAITFLDIAAVKKPVKGVEDR
jgi:hypothetical protein